MHFPLWGIKLGFTLTTVMKTEIHGTLIADLSYESRGI
jgi:hypothetical protein